MPEESRGTMRHAWIMTLKPGAEAEYKRRHDAIWPELAEAILASGVTSFSIYRHGLTLFAYQERDPDVAQPDRPAPVFWRWWRELAPLMETDPDGRPVRTPIEEVFNLAADRAE
ncbi:MAG: L-rhamnose mutarotase [Beijerinckiaceae bacterium]